MKKKTGKFKTIIKEIIYIIIIICILYNICFFINTTITKKEYLSIFKSSFLYAESDAMEPDLKKNDFLIVKKQSNTEIDDIIAYTSNNKIKISKVIEINQDNGKTSYEVKQNANYYPEIKTVKNEQIIGKVVFNIHGLGWMTKILQSKIVTVVVFIILIIRFFYNEYKYKKNIERKRKKEKDTQI